MPRYASAAWRAYRPGSQVSVRAPAVVVADRCRILGLDPGSLRTGYGLIDCHAGREIHVASGCIRVSGGGLAARLRQIFDALQALVSEHRPDEVAVERLRFITSGTAAGPADGQPRVTVSLSVISKSAKKPLESRMDLQTTVVQRLRDL